MKLFFCKANDKKIDKLTVAKTIWWWRFRRNDEWIPDFMSKFACKLKIRSTQEDRRWQIKYLSWFQNKLTQGIATCYSINHRAFKRSDISLAPVFSFALKSTKATVINGLLSRMLLKVSSKFVEKVSNSSCVWLGDL